MEPPAQSTLGRYSLLAKLATGGMAEIHLARQVGIQGFERLVVVKKILPHLAGEPRFLQMFLDEARITVQLNHPNIIQTYDLGQEGGEYYMALEYLEGESLGFLAREASRKSHWPPPALAAVIVAAVADGLAYAHAFTDPEGKPLGIVHRDVSPQNIIVLYNGGVKLVDFGVAKAASKVSQTRAGVLKGKLAYMSPEQCSGSEIDRRADIFSLGVVLWELLAGRRLFKRDNEAATIKAIAFEPLPNLIERRPELPPTLVAITERALAREPAERFQDCAEMSAALRDWLRRSQAVAGPAEIAAFVESVCAERILAKKQLLEQIRTSRGGEFALEMLKPDTAESLLSHSLPGLTSARTDPGREVQVLPPGQSRAGWFVLAGLALVLLAGGGFLLWAGETAGPGSVAVVADAGTIDAGVPVADAGAVTDAGPVGKTPEIPATARLDVFSTPEGCGVEVDGVPAIGPTPLANLSVIPGREHVVVVRCAGHREERKTLLVGEGQRAELRFAPLREEDRRRVPGALRLNTVPWSEVYLGSRKLGITPLLDVPLPAGRHRLTLVNPEAGLSQTLWVTIRSGRTTTLSQKL